VSIPNLPGEHDGTCGWCGGDVWDLDEADYDDGETIWEGPWWVCCGCGSTIHESQWPPKPVQREISEAERQEMREAYAKAKAGEVA